MAQGVTQATPLTLKLRFFWTNPVEIVDPLTRTLYFFQNKQALIRGDIPVTEVDAIDLAGLFFQYTYGTFDKKKKYGLSNAV